jgi:hypothetical protein
LLILRRIRGVIGCALLGAIPWTFVGVISMLLFRLGLIPGIGGYYFRSPISHDLTLAALQGAVFGALSGGVFGILIFASERNRTLEEVRTLRFVAIGALAAASFMGVIYGNVWTALGAGALGAASSASMLWVARRATGPSLSARADDLQLPRK